MRTEHLAYLQLVVHCGSINKASRLLNISQQQLSKIIRQIEDELGATIFVRHQGGVLLTADGELIMSHAEAILQNLDSLKQALKKTSKPIVTVQDIYYHTVSCINLEQTANILDAFSQKFPIFTLHVDEKPATEIFALLQEHSDHVGSLALFADYDYLNPPIPDQLQFIPIFTSSFVVYAARHHPLVQKVKSISLHNLLQEPIVIYNPYYPRHNSIVHDLLSIVGTPQNVSTVTNLSAFYSILKKGKHIALALRQFRQPLQNDASSLAYLPIREKTSVICGLVIRRDIEPTHFLHTFVNFYASYF